MNAVIDCDINTRLQWYLKNDEEDEDEEINIFNPLDIIYTTLDFLDNTRNFVCQRKVKCKCKKECICDSDDFFHIDKFRSDLCSNNKYLFQLFLYNKFNLSQKEGMRIFTMGLITDKDESDENPVFDIKYEFRTEKGCDKAHKFWFVNFLKTPNIIYPLYDGVKIDKNTITFTIDFMNYEK